MQRENTVDKGLIFDNKISMGDIFELITLACGETVMQRIGKLEIPPILFLGLLILLVVGFFYYIFDCIKHLRMNRRNYEKANVELERCAGKNEDMKRNMYFIQRKINKKYKDRKKENIHKLVKPVVAIVVIIGVLFLANPKDAKAFWMGVKTILEVDYDERNGESSEKAENDANEKNTQKEVVNSNDEQDEVKPLNYRFILDEPDKNDFEYKNNEDKKVYFTEVNKESDLEPYIKNYMEKLLTGSHKDNFDEEKMKFYDYSEKEDNFKNKVNCSMNVISYARWKKKAPHSTEMEKYMQGRERLCGICEKEKQGNYLIWWRLANDSQFYAQEYEMQTDNEQAVLYYYTRSIYCCMRALEYNMDDTGRKDICHYMKIRYQDIFRDESIIPGDYKKRAKKVYHILEDIKMD